MKHPLPSLSSTQDSFSYSEKSIIEKKRKGFLALLLLCVRIRFNSERLEE